jgi:hypothetical protein
MAKLNTSVFADEESGIGFQPVESTVEKNTIEPNTIENEIDNSDWVDVDDDIFAIDEPKQPTSEPESTDESIEQPATDPNDGQIVLAVDAVPTSDDATIVAVVEPTIDLPQPAPWDEATENRKDELAFFERLKELNIAIEHAKELFNLAKEDAKLAKDTLNVAVAQLQSFASKGVQYRKKPVPKIAVADHPKSGIGFQPVEPSIPETEWRSWETATILDGIEGLGTKKRDLLIEHFPTFGKLMDAREEAGKEHVSFHSLLPKGIGETIGTEIINRMDAKIVPGM